MAVPHSSEIAPCKASTKDGDVMAVKVTSLHVMTLGPLKTSELRYCTGTHFLKATRDYNNKIIQFLVLTIEVIF